MSEYVLGGQHAFAWWATRSKRVGREEGGLVDAIWE